VRVGLIVSQRADANLVLAARLAFDDANTTGGVRVAGAARKLELVVADGRESPEGATTAAMTLVNRERVAAIVGPYDSHEAIPVARLCERAGMPMIAIGSTHAETTAGKRFVFRACFSDLLQGRVLARFAREPLGARRAAVLYDVAQDYSRGLAEIFRAEFGASGGQVVAFEPFTTDQEDFAPALRRIRDARPEVLFLPGLRPGPVARQASLARELGIGAVFLGSDGWDYAGFARRPEFEGAYFSSHWRRDDPSAESRAFVERFARGGGVLHGETEALTWDACQLLVAAMRRAGDVTPTAVRQGLATLGEFHGATGLMRFSGQDPAKTVFVSRFRQGGHGLVLRAEPDAPPQAAQAAP
jgi:branched-chain amino acid transport system substrate-binding protein